MERGRDCVRFVLLAFPAGERSPWLWLFFFFFLVLEVFVAGSRRGGSRAVEVSDGFLGSRCGRRLWFDGLFYIFFFFVEIKDFNFMISGMAGFGEMITLLFIIITMSNWKEFYGNFDFSIFYRCFCSISDATEDKFQGQFTLISSRGF